MKKTVSILLSLAVTVLLSMTVTAAMAGYDFGSYSGELHPWIHGYGREKDYTMLRDYSEMQRWHPGLNRYRPTEWNARLRYVMEEDFIDGKHYHFGTFKEHAFIRDDGSNRVYSSEHDCKYHGMMHYSFGATRPCQRIR